MGTFQVALELGDPDGTRWEAVQALVDTGSTFTWAPRDLLGRLGMRPAYRWEFRTADGRIVERDVTLTQVRLGGEERTTLVVFGEDGASALLGAYTLEAFLLAPDPVNQRLVRVQGLAM